MKRTPTYAEALARVSELTGLEVIAVERRKQSPTQRHRTRTTDLWFLSRHHGGTICLGNLTHVSDPPHLAEILRVAGSTVDVTTARARKLRRALIVAVHVARRPTEGAHT